MTIKFIAEIGPNHNGDLNRAIDLIQACKWAGFNAVKFQYLDIEAMFAPEVLEKRADIRDRAKYNFDPAWLSELKETCHRDGLEFGMTCYQPEDVEEVIRFVDFIKVSSYDLLNVRLLEKLSYLVIPLIVSTGMASLIEIEECLDRLKSRLGLRNPFLLHCISEYPCGPYQANLIAIKTLKETFDRPVGWSDHTGLAGVIHRAIHWGAEVIELHVDLDDGKGVEQEQYIWPMTAAKILISEVRIGELADGDGIKQPRPGELSERDWRTDKDDGMRPTKGIR